ncbi:hypothetical protein BdWA1_000731 [Babesia duncani]|uniref:Uncharacterized protein n=1 Tax=Babesia duncani TaxID=323732 RepID=A0AAD9PNQ7_9APIC|nr:hypothetical protein BdWA1_000731 [Babesia duncani]
MFIPKNAKLYLPLRSKLLFMDTYKKQVVITRGMFSYNHMREFSSGRRNVPLDLKVAKRNINYLFWYHLHGKTDHFTRKSTLYAFRNPKSSTRATVLNRLATLAIVAFASATIGYALYLENATSILMQTSGGAIGKILSTNSFRKSVLEFANGIVADVLNSPETQGLLVEKVNHVLANSQGAIKQAVLDTLDSPQVLSRAEQFSRAIIDVLSNDPQVQQQVGHLLLESIYTREAVEGAAEWVVNLSERQDTRDAIALVFTQRILQDAEMQELALEFCRGVGSEYIKDKETLMEASAFIKALLDRPSFQAYLSQILWDVFKQVIYPRWFVG